MSPLLALLACLPSAPMGLAPDTTPPGWEGPATAWAELYARAEHFEALTQSMVPGLAPRCVRAHVMVRLAEEQAQPSLVLDTLTREVRLRCGPTGGHAAEVLAQEARP